MPDNAGGSTWGPFTGRQLTLIIVALVVTLIPSSVWAAATFSNVSVYDPKSEKRVAVDGQRRLKIGDGQGALTVDGVTRQAPPSSFVEFGGSSLDSGCTLIYAPPQGKALVVTWLALNTFGNPSPGAANNALVYSGTSCGGLPSMTFNPGGLGVLSVNPEPGLVVPAGEQLRVFRGGNISAELYGAGYLIPASQA